MRRFSTLVLLLLLLLAACQNGGLIGKKFTVPNMRIEGTKEVKDDDLIAAAQRDLERFVKNDRRLADADDAAFAMEVLLREKGYPKASVGFQVQGPELVFHVEEGPHAQFAGVRFPGARREFVPDLESYFEFKGSGFLFLGPTFLNRAEVVSAIARVKEYYLKRGFIDVKVAEPELDWNAARTEAHVVLEVTEGKQYHITSLTIEGADPKYLVGHELTGKPFNPAAPFRVGADVRRQLRNEAYIFAKTEVVSTVDKESGGVAVKVTADKGEFTRLGEIRFHGTGAVRQSFMRGRYALKRGDPVRLKDLEGGTAELYRSRLFESIEPELKPLAPGWTDLDVQVDAGNTKRVEVSGGWGTWEKLWGRVDYVDHNVFRAGRVLRAGALASMRSLGADIQLEDPWILGIDNWIWVKFSALQREERFYDYEGYGAELVVERRFDRKNRLKGGYTFSIEEASNVDASIPDDQKEQVEGFQRTAGLFAEYRLDLRDDLFIPTKGALLELRTAWSTEVLGASLSFVELEARASYYVPLGDWSVLAFGASAATRVPYAGTVMPIQQRYFLGGQQSVRSFGYEELTPTDEYGNGVGGLSALEAHVEWRPRIWQMLHGALFVDVGQVSLDSFSFDAPLGWGIGAGLRYYTPVGPVRVDAAYNPGDMYAATNRWHMHFSFGFSF